MEKNVKMKSGLLIAAALASFVTAYLPDAPGARNNC